MAAPSISQNTVLPKYTKAEFQTDQVVRWCPGCGEHATPNATTALRGLADKV